MNSITNSFRILPVIIILSFGIIRAAPTPISVISPIEVFGSKFFVRDTGEQFFIRGIAYQPSIIDDNLEVDVRGAKYIDPLGDPKLCLRDIPHLKKLKINTIRVYSVDPSKSHDTCMQALAEAGIYVLLDLAEPDTSIVRNKPSWDIIVWKRYMDVIDAMHQYSNLLGFFSGNEVTNDITNTDASPFVKAAIRDVKEYIDANGYRKIPVGYSTNDDADTRDELAQYFSCGGEAAADFYGINMYEWCGYSSYGTSGYKERTKEFEDFPIPIFFSEFGCNLVRPRPFTEVGALYGAKMSKVWSGGLAYMYFEEENEYGVVKIDGNNKVIELEDFHNLRAEFQKVNPERLDKLEYLKTVKPAVKTTCPKISNYSNWKGSTKLPQKPDYNKCDCMQKTLPFLVKPFKSSLEHQEYFDGICSQVNCSDTIADGELGIYGSFSDCTSEQKLALQVSKLYSDRLDVAVDLAMDNEHIYYNSEYLDRIQRNDECSTMVEDVLDIKNTLQKSIKKDDENSSDGADLKVTKSNAGSSSHYVNSGCALFFVTIFIASFLL